MNNRKLIKATILPCLLKDVLILHDAFFGVAPYAKLGYLFSPNRNGRIVASGKCCNYESEINAIHWRYFIKRTNKKQIYKIKKEGQK
jgi:hypothetical protein